MHERSALLVTAQVARRAGYDHPGASAGEAFAE
jgi:hypothetical protein